jgi:PhzF family phenazine biosynthesis protein
MDCEINSDQVGFSSAADGLISIRPTAPEREGHTVPEIQFAQIDAFASEPFTGNQACVMPLEAFLPDPILQKIAAENNVAETAFLVPDGDARWQLRWFTPTTEVPLCGHATLAAAHALFTLQGVDAPSLTFVTQVSGELFVTQRPDGRLEMDFPAPEMVDIPLNPALTRALGAEPVRLVRGPYLAAQFDSVDTVVGLKPDMELLCRIGDETEAGPGNVGCYAFGGRGVDVTSRFFAPGSGINEDPATGSWHCMIAGLAGPIGPRPISCFQAHPGRGAHIEVELVGPRIKLRGHCQTVIEGRFRF